MALEMAERFKVRRREGRKKERRMVLQDFRLLMVITKSMEDDERRGLLDGYKR